MSEKQRKTEEYHAILKDVYLRGEKVFWGYLHDRGHHFMQVKACVSKGWLKSPSSYHYEITPAGRAALNDSEEIVQIGRKA